MVAGYRILSLRESVELQPLDKSPMRAELSSVEILLVESISDLKEYSISVSLLLSHKKRGRKINITTVLCFDRQNIPLLSRLVLNVYTRIHCTRITSVTNTYTHIDIYLFWFYDTCNLDNLHDHTYYLLLEYTYWWIFGTFIIRTAPSPTANLIHIYTRKSSSHAGLK